MLANSTFFSGSLCDFIINTSKLVTDCYILYENCIKTLSNTQLCKTRPRNITLMCRQVKCMSLSWHTPYLYCHPATSVDIQRDEMSCHAGPQCYMNTDIQRKVKQYKPIHHCHYWSYCQLWLYRCYIYIYIYIYIYKWLPINKLKIQTAQLWRWLK